MLKWFSVFYFKFRHFVKRISTSQCLISIKLSGIFSSYVQMFSDACRYWLRIWLDSRLKIKCKTLENVDEWRLDCKSYLKTSPLWRQEQLTFLNFPHAFKGLNSSQARAKIIFTCCEVEDGTVVNVSINISAGHQEPVRGVLLEMINVETAMIWYEVISDHHIIIIIIIIRSISDVTRVHPATDWIHVTGDQGSYI